ncbi:MAG: hypothetical protein AAF730_14465 [Bacteroidota bacterium]
MPRLSCFVALLLFAAPAIAQDVDLSHFENMEARAIGPAGMSGRVTAIDVVLRDPDVIYAGTASGGLWMSEGGGIDWTPIFDDQPVASIGDIAIYQKNPSIIYVGTGEGNPRNSQTNGNGLYKTLDGGKTWSYLGLEDSRNIHRVIVHPDNPDVVWAGVQGPAWGTTETRGVYKSTDGGQNWRKVLYQNERTGIADLVADPSNPDKLFAAMWEFQRWPWTFTSGGDGSGLFVSHDGGENWVERTSVDGLPAGDLGRIGLAISPSRPDILYALVESKKNGLFKSEDGGVSWSRVNAKGNFGNRPFYYHEIHIDPVNENRLYSLHSIVTYSEDGGRTWETLIPYAGIHPDHHAWWIHPEDPDYIIEGNDGGMAISRDRGETWRHIENLPLAQFYHINVDNSFPYRVCGGMQDNGSWCGPSQVFRNGQIRNSYWEEVAFGDGFDVVIDSSDSRYGYAMSQGGNLQRFDSHTGDQKYIKPIHPDGETLRFNWNAAIAHDPFGPTTIYYGSQMVHKSTDRGDSWTIISPDLTTNDPEKQKQVDSGGLTYDVTQAENYTTIVSLEPSQLQPGILWAGTDDGHVQVTQDGGQTWTNVTGNVRGIPDGIWVPQIKASVHNVGEAFVVFGDHRRNNWEPYLYHTDDFGRSWTRLIDGDDVYGYLHSFAQDPVEPNLMFAGSEFGLYVSFDGGDAWQKWTHGVPTVAVTDMVIHPREHDLVMGTFGRSAFILDDLRPLRAVAADMDVLDAPLTAFEAPDAYHVTYRQATGVRFAGDAAFFGENRMRGGMLSFFVAPVDTTDDDAKPLPKKITMQIVDPTTSDTIRTFKRDVQAGFNRTTWGLEQAGYRFPTMQKPRKDAPEPGNGGDVMPGTYEVVMTLGEHTSSTMIDVKLDPRLGVTPAMLQARADMRDEMVPHIEALADALTNLREARETVDLLAQHLEDRDDETAKTAMDLGKAVKDSIQVMVEMYEGPEVQGIRRDPNTIRSRMSIGMRYLGSSWDMPGPTERTAMAQSKAAIKEMVDAVNALFAEQWPAYQRAIRAADLQLFEPIKPISVSIN